MNVGGTVTGVHQGTRK